MRISIVDSCRKRRAKKRRPPEREGRTVGTCLKAAALGKFCEQGQPCERARWSLVQDEAVGPLVPKWRISKWERQSFKLNTGPSRVSPVWGPGWEGLVLFFRGWNHRHLPSPDPLKLQGSLQVCFSFSAMFLSCLLFFFSNSAASCINILQFPYEKFPRGPC